MEQSVIVQRKKHAMKGQNETIHKRGVSRGRSFMLVKCFIPVLLILIIPTLLSACIDPPSTAIGITPIDTSAGTLQVTIRITEDQKETNGMSDLTLQFRTNVVEEDNYVIFTHQEAVTCNGVPLKLNNAANYTLQVRVAQKAYSCIYTGYTKGIGPRAPVTMIDFPARSVLNPQLPIVGSQGYSIKYTPDKSELACPIKADASAGTTTITGSESSSARGSYDGPDVTSLTGDGNVLLQRECSWTLHNAFDTVSLTYQSKASIAVTWN